MVRDIRIKEYRFPIADITSSSAGLFDAYTSHPINGKILSIQRDVSNYTATGSLTLLASGTAQNIWRMISGTIVGAVTLEQVSYPRAFANYEINTVISGTTAHTEVVEIPVSTVLHLVGSGLGDSKSGISITIQYQ